MADKAEQMTARAEEAALSAVMMLTIHIYGGLTNALEQAVAQEAETLAEVRERIKRNHIPPKTTVWITVKAREEPTQTVAADAVAEVGFLDTTEEQAATTAEAEVRAVLGLAGARVHGQSLRVVRAQAAETVTPHYFIERRSESCGGLART